MSKLLVLALILAGPATALAQEPTKPAFPDSASMEQLSGMFDRMIPMYRTMSQAMMEGTLAALDREETASSMARFARRYYQALILEGFTKEEALQIVAGMGVIRSPGLK